MLPGQSNVILDAPFRNEEARPCLVHPYEILRQLELRKSIGKLGMIQGLVGKTMLGGRLSTGLDELAPGRPHVETTRCKEQVATCRSSQRVQDRRSSGT